MQFQYTLCSNSLCSRTVALSWQCSALLWQSTHLSLAKKLDLSIHELAISPPPPVLVPHGGDRDAHDDRDDVAPDDHHELVVSK